MLAWRAEMLNPCVTSRSFHSTSAVSWLSQLGGGFWALQRTCTSTALINGKNRYLFAGTVHWFRVTGPTKLPTRKNTGPDWPTPHPAPVESTSGFEEAGR